MRETASLLIGFLSAAIVAGVMFASFTWVTDESGIHGVQYVEALFVIGIFFSGVATLLLGVPAFLVLKYFDLVRWWTALFLGFAIGVIAASITGAQTSDSIRRVIAFGAIGAISALVFWLTRKVGRIVRN